MGGCRPGGAVGFQKGEAMRKAVFAMLFAMPCAVFADWALMQDAPDGREFYIDPKTARKVGENNRTIWTLYNMAKNHSGAAKSLRTLNEYDCAGDRVRTLTATSHSQRQARGEVVDRGDTPQPWKYIAPGTINEEVLKMVCGR